jgi:hypothetical protein
LIQEEIKKGLNFGNACYHLVQNLLSSHLLSKNVKIIIYKTLILPVVLYRLRVFDNRVLKIFEPKKDEVMGEKRKLHNKELRDMYSSLSIIRIIKLRRMRWAGHVARLGEKRNVYRLLAGKPEGKRPLGRPRCKWMDNIGMDLGEVGCSDMDWIGVAQDNRWRALVNSEFGIEPSGSIKCLETIKWPNNWWPLK